LGTINIIKLKIKFLWEYEEMVANEELLYVLSRCVHTDILKHVDIYG